MYTADRLECRDSAQRWPILDQQQVDSTGRRRDARKRPGAPHRRDPAPRRCPPAAGAAIRPGQLPRDVLHPPPAGSRRLGRSITGAVAAVIAILILVKRKRVAHLASSVLFVSVVIAGMFSRARRCSTWSSALASSVSGPASSFTAGCWQRLRTGDTLHPAAGAADTRLRQLASGARPDLSARHRGRRARGRLPGASRPYRSQLANLELSRRRVPPLRTSAR